MYNILLLLKNVTNNKIDVKEENNIFSMITAGKVIYDDSAFNLYENLMEYNEIYIGYSKTFIG